MNSLYTYYKSLAYEEELRTVESSEDEYQEFITGVARPDFANKDILCVKFLVVQSPNSIEEAEETPWFINPNAVKAPPCCTRDDFGTKMPEDYPPYLLLISSRYPNRNLLFAYDLFLSEGVTDDHDYRVDYPQSYTLFSAWYSKNPY